MSLRLMLDLALRRLPWLLPVSLVLLTAMALLAPSFLRVPSPEIVAPIDDGSRRAEAHYQAFQAILIPHDALEAKQSAIIDLALRHGLVPGRIEFAPGSDAFGVFDRASLTLPLRGEFVDFQKFLAAALASEPALAVGDLALQRDENGSGIHARLRLVFHLKPAERAHP